MASQRLSSGHDVKVLLRKIFEVEGTPERIMAKELLADENGAIYAALAGFRVGLLVGSEDRNFFTEWENARGLDRLEPSIVTDSYPNANERARAVEACLRRVIERTDIFNLGVLLYEAGHYEEAASAFEEFLLYFPSTEVQHNLGCCYHQMALRDFRAWKQSEPVLPFKLSFAIDPVTRATQIDLRSDGLDYGELFKEHLSKAIEFYRNATLQDPFYVPAYSSFGAACVLAGEYHKAISLLQDALKLDPNSSDVWNNLGVAYYGLGMKDEATQAFTRANELDANFDAALFNLGKVAFEEGNLKGASMYWKRYLRRDPTSSWAHVILEAMEVDPVVVQVGFADVWQGEDVGGLQPGAFEDELPPGFGSRMRSKEVKLGSERFKMSLYDNGVVSISRDGMMIVLCALDDYRGQSSRGISIGSTEDEVITLYGYPCRRLEMTQGKCWCYDDDGIAFVFRDGRVAYWLIYCVKC